MEGTLQVKKNKQVIESSVKNSLKPHFRVRKKNHSPSKECDVTPTVYKYDILGHENETRPM